MAMYAVVVKGGKFTFTVDKDLSRGLRPTKRNPRNEEYLVVCNGAVGQDKVLTMLEKITPMATSAITDGFPFPQLFVFTHALIVCGQKVIYEMLDGVLTLMYTAAQAGGPWTAVDYGNYVYMSNGRIVVKRDAGSQLFTLDSTLPCSTAACDYNGQMMIGAPGIPAPGLDRNMEASPIEIEVTQRGTFSHA